MGGDRDGPGAVCHAVRDEGPVVARHVARRLLFRWRDQSLLNAG